MGPRDSPGRRPIASPRQPGVDGSVSGTVVVGSGNGGSVKGGSRVGGGVVVDGVVVGGGLGTGDSLVGGDVDGDPASVVGVVVTEGSSAEGSQAGVAAERREPVPVDRVGMLDAVAV